MILIAHRGNLEGRKPWLENKPAYIDAALDRGFDAEADVWFKDGGFLLGHDGGQYTINEDFLLKEGLWCHAKNLTSLIALQKLGAHCFFHEDDDATYTSKGYIWLHGRNREYEWASDKSILLKPENGMPIDFHKHEDFRKAFTITTELYKDFGGICTDYAKILRDG